MSLTRRQLVQAVAASTVGAVAFTGCAAPGSLHEFQLASHVRAPEDLVSAEDNWYATLCPQCEAGLGVIVRIVGGRAKKLEGNPDYPVNAGKLSAQGQAAVQELYHPDRIAGPLRRSGARFSGSLQPITWDEGIAELVARLRPLVGGPAGSVLMMTEPLRGHLALVVEQFSRGIGARRATFEPLERKAVVREAARRVFGLDQIPELDIANARHVLSFGADFLGTWLSPVHYSRAFGEFRHGRSGTGAA